MDIDELSENFELLDDWEDKYRYLIDLGEKLPPFAEECRTDEWKVSGCQSQVWLVPSFVREGNDVRLHFAGDSDAAIVRGLIAVANALTFLKRKGSVRRKSSKPKVKNSRKS